MITIKHLEMDPILAFNNPYGVDMPLKNRLNQTFKLLWLPSNI